jgi:hypothetical protein
MVFERRLSRRNKGNEGVLIPVRGCMVFEQETIQQAQA